MNLILVKIIPAQRYHFLRYACFLQHFPPCCSPWKQIADWSWWIQRHLTEVLLWQITFQSDLFIYKLSGGYYTRVPISRCFCNMQAVAVLLTTTFYKWVMSTLGMLLFLELGQSVYGPPSVPFRFWIYAKIVSIQPYVLLFGWGLFMTELTDETLISVSKHM